MFLKQLEIPKSSLSQLRSLEGICIEVLAKGMGNVGLTGKKEEHSAKD
jgi:hypothetical protein